MAASWSYRPPALTQAESGLSTCHPLRRSFGGQVLRQASQLVDKSLVRITSNSHSKSRLKGPTFTVEPDRGAISETVPGNRTEDRKVVGHGPGGESTITSNRDCRYASRRTAGSFGRFVVRSTPCALHGPVYSQGTERPTVWLGMDTCGCSLRTQRGDGSTRATRRPSEVRRCGAATAVPRRRYARSAGSSSL
jgi:hypothetical protein